MAMSKIRQGFLPEDWAENVDESTANFGERCYGQTADEL